MRPNERNGLGRRIGLGLIWVYRTCLSGLKPPCCRFYPTCSAYAAEAVVRYGLAGGAWLSLQRLLRCHPFHRGPLYDPVPEGAGAFSLAPTLDRWSRRVLPPGRPRPAHNQPPPHDNAPSAKRAP